MRSYGAPPTLQYTHAHIHTHTHTLLLSTWFDVCARVLRRACVLRCGHPTPPHHFESERLWQVPFAGEYFFGALLICDLTSRAARSPMLYDAYHEVYNLSRLGERCVPGASYQIVGPICETGDLIGRDRALPPTAPGDVVLVANAGAYGAVMASAYNMRPIAEQAVLE